MSTRTMHRQPAVVSVGCGWRKSRSFLPGKERVPLLKPANHQLPDASPCRATKQSSSYDLGPSVSSSETFAIGKSFSDELSVSTDDDEESLSGLLRQLNELEQSVRAWKPSQESSPPPPEKAESGGKLGESVAVVKTSDDPVADFRGSMLQMIVEKEIVTINDLRELLRCFLSLNSPQHHAIILRAFLEIWSDLFSRSPEKRRHSDGADNFSSTPRSL